MFRLPKPFDNLPINAFVSYDVHFADSAHWIHNVGVKCFRREIQRRVDGFFRQPRMGLNHLFDGFTRRKFYQDHFHSDTGSRHDGLPIITDGSD